MRHRRSRCHSSHWVIRHCRNRPASRRRLSLESLEPRRVLSGSYDACVAVLGGPEGESADPKVAIRLAVTDEAGVPIESIGIGQTAFLAVSAQDVRPPTDVSGVFAAYLDVSYDADLVAPRVASNYPLGFDVRFSDQYQNGKSGSARTPGLLDEVGAFQSGYAPLGTEPRVIFRVPLDATSIVPVHDILAGIPDGAGKLIVVDGVFSMEGDLADLPNIVRLAKKYDARVMVDDAHGIGVMGEHGRGTAEHFGVEDEVDLVMGTFSKTFASLGGFVAGRESVIHYLKHFSRSLIFSASIPPGNAAAVRAALEIVRNEPQLRHRLWEITHKMKKKFDDLGFNTGKSETPIIPVYIGDDLTTFNVCMRLHEEGVFVNPVISPAVPPGQSLIRASFMANHTDEELDYVLKAFEKVGRELGIIQ